MAKYVMYIPKIYVYIDNTKTGRLIEEVDVRIEIGFSGDIESAWRKAYQFYQKKYKEHKIAIHLPLKMEKNK